MTSPVSSCERPADTDIAAFVEALAAELSDASVR